MKRFAIVLILLAGCITEPEYEMGDVNMDGRVTTADAELVVKSIVDCYAPRIVVCSTLTGQPRALADTDKDQRVTPGDASIILAWAGGSDIFRDLESGAALAEKLGIDP